MKFLKEKLLLSEKGYSDLKKAIVACTLTNIALLLPAGVTTLLFWQLLNPFYGKDISWGNMWGLLIVGIIASLLVFLAARNDYRKTYLASYKEASNTRLRIAEHLRKLPMSFFNSRDLSDITTNMMADCASMESMLSSTIPPLIANVISVTLTCVCLAFFDWRMALALFATMPITFLIIWAGRNLQIRMFDRQVGIKLEASSQIQEYLEGIKIIKSCGLSGERFSTLNRALLAMKKVAIQAELVSGVLVQSAALILQASLGIAIFVGTVLITGGQIELLPLLVLLMFSTQLYGPILAILSQLTSLFHLGTVTKRMRMLLTTPAMEGNEQDVHTYDIELKNVTFAYAKEDVIKDVSLKIPSGSITALVGPSGSGKSTISKLIARFWDVQKGSITIGGENIKNIEPEHLMKSISFVFQDVTLFNDTVREQVIDDLKQYPELKKKVILLRYEQEHPAKISDSEVIDSMALSRPVSDGIRPAGFISDKTMRIATQFRDKKDRLNQETIMEIAQELYTVEQQISKLEFYVSQLEEKQAEVIRKYYFEGKTWGELQREMHLAPRTLLKRRDDGLDALVSIYSYIGQVKGDRRNT